MWAPIEHDDVERVLREAPEALLVQLKDHPLLLAGGCIRSVISERERINDFDVFGPEGAPLRERAEQLAEALGGSVRYSPIAYQVRADKDRIKVDYIRLWFYNTPEALLEDFDFTVDQAVIWWTGGAWGALAHPRFYTDLYDGKLVFGRQNPDETSHTPLTRLELLKDKGYKIDINELSRVRKAIEAVKEAKHKS